MKVLISGSHGLIGSHLVTALEARGDEVIRLVRGRADKGDVSWDPADGTVEAADLEGIDAVVHLAGEGIGDKRWTPTHKARVLDSRVRGTRILAEALVSLTDKPKVMISGSAIGFYGLRGDEVLTEDSGSGDDFLAGVVRAWEDAAQPAAAAGIRVVKARTGLVLSSKGGILPRMALPMKLFVGGRLGSGEQYMSWVSIEDEIGAILHLIDGDLEGPVNVTAPAPVTNKEFTEALGRVMGRPSFFRVPAVALELALGKEMAQETVLASQRVLPQRLEASGYTFVHTDLEDALEAQLG